MTKDNDPGSFPVHGSLYDVSIKILVCHKLLVRLLQLPGLQDLFLLRHRINESSALDQFEIS